DDKILSYLSRCLINRNLPISKILNEPFKPEKLNELKEQAKRILEVEDGSYFVHQSSIRVIPYDKENSAIFILNKDQSLQEISNSPLQILSHHLLNPIEKYHLCYLAVKKK